MKVSKSKTRFYIYSIALLPYILLLTSGVIMLYYHTGASYESTFWGQDGNFWLAFHKYTMIVTTPLILLHLFVKTKWVKNFFLFKQKGKFKISNTVLFIFFLVCLFSSLSSWIVFDNSDIAILLRGIHNKFGILLIIVSLIHFGNYWKVIINQVKKLSK